MLLVHGTKNEISSTRLFYDISLRTCVNGRMHYIVTMPKGFSKL